MKKIDRYSLLCFSVSIIILMTVFIEADEPNKDEGIIGIAHDVKATLNGYTFYLEDSDGGEIRCFVRSEPTEFEIYEVKGSISDDGSMLFVSSMRCLR